ncbi:hypothetical protein TIFTF001_024209 [Ficus carica]|uniref:Uncharacterized protein n=1 Tax=Ficus carica TaxID=3494 RepID=A0AA88DKB8_FICCA|nr:hypothetical protein TIFTF001_024209 [Ficus carica]
MRIRHRRRRASPSTAGTTRNAGEHDGPSPENPYEKRCKIESKSPENSEEIAATGASVKVRLRREWRGSSASQRWDRNDDKSRSQNRKLSPRDIVGGGARSRSSVLVAVSTGPPASSRWFLRRSSGTLPSPVKLALG